MYNVDNAIVVLQTWNEKNDKIEFRVSYVENLYELYTTDFDKEKIVYGINKDLIRKIFSSVKVYNNIDEAFEEAEILSQNYEYLENGIVLESKFTDMKFT